MKTVSLDQVTPKPPPSCPDCGQPMRYYGGTYGWVCCSTKILHRADGWLDANGKHKDDPRLAKGGRRS
jgi:hypothetical protein